MLENIFILLMIIAFILFIIALEKESFGLCVMSAIFWLVVMAQSFNIVVPGDTSYTDFTIQAVCLVFIFVSVALSIAFYMGHSLRKRYNVL